MDKDMISAFVFVFMALGAFVIFVSLVPANFFYAGSKTYAEQDMPEGESWSALYLQASNSTLTIRFNATSQNYDFDIGGRNLRFGTVYNVLEHTCGISHMYGWSLLFNEDMDWYNEEQYKHGSEMTDSAFDNDYEDFGRLNYLIQCEGLAGGPLGGSSRFNIQGSMSFNETTYATPGDAWAGSELYITFGITFDQSNTSINAWDMIGRLLLFQRVDVFGTSTEANAMDTIMSFSLWAFIAILAFIVVMELIPF